MTCVEEVMKTLQSRLEKALFLEVGERGGDKENDKKKAVACMDVSTTEGKQNEETETAERKTDAGAELLLGEAAKKMVSEAIEDISGRILGEIGREKPTFKNGFR